MNSAVRNFVNNEKMKLMKSKAQIPTIMDLIKDHNHEIWRVCRECAHVFDLRDELKIDECPKCKSKNIG